MQLARLCAVAIALPLAIGCRSDLAGPSAKSASSPLRRSAADGIPTQADADAISANIVKVHLPYGTMADPGFVTSDPTSPDYYAVSTYNTATTVASNPYISTNLGFQYEINRQWAVVAGYEEQTGFGYIGVNFDFSNR